MDMLLMRIKYEDLIFDFFFCFLGPNLEQENCDGRFIMRGFSVRSTRNPRPWPIKLRYRLPRRGFLLCRFILE
jgi:hypothetical protein